MLNVLWVWLPVSQNMIFKQWYFVRQNMLEDCPVTNDNIHAAHNSYGPDLASIRRETVGRKPVWVVIDYVEIPLNFITIHGQVTLVADLLFINSIPFLVSAS